MTPTTHRGLAKDDARFKRLHPGAMRFALLALGVAAAGVLQGWVTLRAPSLGVALSGADPQWASLHWLLLPVAAVCLSFVRPADWPQLGSLLGGALSSVNAALAFLFSHLVFRPEWVTRSRT